MLHAGLHAAYALISRVSATVDWITFGCSHLDIPIIVIICDYSSTSILKSIVQDVPHCDQVHTDIILLVADDVDLTVIQGPSDHLATSVRRSHSVTLDGIGAVVFGARLHAAGKVCQDVLSHLVAMACDAVEAVGPRVGTKAVGMSSGQQADSGARNEEYARHHVEFFWWKGRLSGVSRLFVC